MGSQEIALRGVESSIIRCDILLIEVRLDIAFAVLPPSEVPLTYAR